MKLQGRTNRLLVISAIVGLLLGILLTMQASALPAVDDGVEFHGLLTADDGQLDVGAEYTADQPPLGSSSGDLPLCRTSARSFYYRLRDAGFTGSDSFIYGNQSAWEKDWKRSALGGTENNYVDDVDIAYYCDHGSTGSVSFPWDHSDTSLVPNDCYQSWGDKDAEWLAFGTCLTLKTHQGWANCMNGLHLILGYKTVSYDADEGKEWAKQMLGWKFLGIWFRAPKTVTQAWFTMCDKTQPSSVIAAVIAEDSRHYGDKLHGRGGPAYGDVVNNTYYYLTHSCHKPAPIKVSTALLAELPVYEVVPRTVDEGYAQNIAETLNMSGTLQSDGEVFAITDASGGVTRTVEIDMASGGYIYQNVSELWVPPAPGEPLSLPGPEEAQAMAEGFFLANQTLPGAQYRTDGQSFTETVGEVVKESTQSLKAGTILREQGLDVMVSYGRQIGTGSALASEVSVAGPGASTKVYIGQSGDSPLAAEQLPIGLQGGSRDVQNTGKGTAVQDADKAWADFLEDPGLAVVAVPLEADEIIRYPISDTLAYYEQPHGVSQQELIPVWVFHADFMKEGQLLAPDVIVYVPASPDYYPPTVVIDEPASGTVVRAGEELTFSASASGPYQPFTYEWTSSHDGILGTDPSVTAGLRAYLHPGQSGLSIHSIAVSVTNANGQSRVVRITVDVMLPLHLPMILRG